MGNSDEVMYNHEEEVMRIRNIREKNEQDYEIRKFIAANNLKLGEEEIRRLRDKDLKEYEIKNKELRIKEEEIQKKHLAEMTQINNTHLENVTKESNRAHEENKRIDNDFLIKKEQLKMRE